MKKRSILVCGAAGMMPSHFVDYLVDHFSDMFDIYGVDDLSGGYRENINPKCRFTRLDLADFKKTRAYFKKTFPNGVDVLIQAAAAAQEIRSYFTPVLNARSNDAASINPITCALNHGVKHIVYFSSMSRYGDGAYINGNGQAAVIQNPPFTEDMIPAPRDPYASSKVYVENFIKSMANVHDFTWTIWVPHNAFSPRQYIDPYRNFLAIWMNLMLMGKDCYIYGSGEQRRAISWVDDYCPIICESIFNDQTYGQTINIGGDEHCSINQWFNIVRNITGWEREPVRIASRPGEAPWAFCSHEKAERLTGFKNLTTINDALGEMWDYFKRKGPRPFRYLDGFEIVSDKIPATWRKRLF